MYGVAVVLILVLLALGVARRYRLGVEGELVVAVIRALLQLGALALVIQLLLDRLTVSWFVLIVMLLAAARTAGHRLRGVPGAARLAAVAILVASGLALLVLFGLRVFSLESRFLIPVAGMLIGNSMTAASLAGSRLRDEIADKTLEIEARLALGVRASEAFAPYIRRAAATALIPTIDSTKNVGLVFLPGAFVGMILGGASPLQAAQVQLVVLFMLLGAVSVAGMLTAVLVMRTFIGPGERLQPPDPASQ